MENIDLNAQVRTTEEKLSEVRASKMIPAVVYGKHQEPILLKLDYSVFLKTFRKTWESHIINLKTGKKDLEVLVHEIQKEPISWDYLHIDFYAITKGEKVHTKIHFNFIGASQAVKEWAILEELMKEVEVKVLPKDLVDWIDVDLSELKEMWDSLRLSDLKIDTSKFDILTPDSIVVTASIPAKIEVLEPIEDVAVTGADEEENKEEEK